MAQYNRGTLTMSAREVLRYAYQYANYVFDVASPFLMYQFLVFSRSYDLQDDSDRSALKNYANSRLGNIPADLLNRNAIFKITDNELNSLVDQQTICGTGKTRADAITDLIDKFVTSLQYRDYCNSATGIQDYVELYFDAQYKLILQSLGLRITDVYGSKDQGRNMVYGFIFQTTNYKTISMFDNRSYNIPPNYFSFSGINKPLCPVMATLPQCVVKAQEVTGTVF